MTGRTNNPYAEMPRKARGCFGRDEAAEDLRRKIGYGVNTVVMGAEGIGKSTFLDSFFTHDLRVRMAQEEHILINIISYPTDLASAEIYTFFANAVRDAAEILESCGRADIYADIMDRARKYQERGDAPVNRFQNICKYMHDRNYLVALVIDQFERFTTSRHVRPEHHDVMRNVLADKNLCFIVATDYDFNEDSLPPNAAGSLLLQLFAGHEITLTGLTAEQCGQCLYGVSGREDFTAEELRRLCRLSGGLPRLLFRAAYHAWEQKQAAPEIDWRAVRLAALRDCEGLLERWISVLTLPEKQLLNVLCGQTEEATPIPVELRDTAAPLLLSRGLIVDLEDNCYDFNSLLLQSYCRQHLPQSLTPAPTPIPAPSAPPIPAAAPAQVINYYNYENATFIQSEGGTVAAGDINVQHNELHGEGLSVMDILELLGEPASDREGFARRLSERMHSLLPAAGLPALPDTAYGSQAERDDAVDRAFEAYSGHLLAEVQVDEDQELANVPAEAQETLDLRFEQAYVRCRPSLDAALLDTLGERCRVYIKLSVVVEDALSVLGADTMQDCSPQLVLYGKALEQALRDNLFELFHRERQLSVYDTYRHRADPSGTGSEIFKNKRMNEAYIGNFVHMMNHQGRYLGALCAANGVEAPQGRLTEEQWTAWWNELMRDAEAARVIRNMADHTDDTSPCVRDIDRMFDLLFGANGRPGILVRLQTGSRLFLKLFPPRQDMREALGMAGREVMFCCEERTGPGGLRGHLQDGGHPANVSPKEWKRAAQELQLRDPVGKTLRARVLEYKVDPNRSFFRLALLPPAPAQTQ